MNAFLLKEIKEITKTHRLWAVPLFFLFLGLSAVAATEFLPDILKSQLQTQNISIKLPEPDAVQAFQTYFKNLTQLGLVAVILMSMGLVSEEKARGILAQILAKPVSRAAIVAAKGLVHGGWFIICLAAAAAGSYVYALGLFGRADAARFVLANLVFALYLILIFSLTLAASAAARGQGAAAAAALAGFIVLSVASAFGRNAGRYSPGALSDLAFNIVSGRAEIVDALWPALTALVLAAALLAGGILIFSRQEL